jgi:hypothetical protein
VGDHAGIGGAVAFCVAFFNTDGLFQCADGLIFVVRSHFLKNVQ